MLACTQFSHNPPGWKERAVIEMEHMPIDIFEGTVNATMSVLLGKMVREGSLHQSAQGRDLSNAHVTVLILVAGSVGTLGLALRGCVKHFTLRGFVSRAAVGILTSAAAYSAGASPSTLTLGTVFAGGVVLSLAMAAFKRHYWKR